MLTLDSFSALSQKVDADKFLLACSPGNFSRISFYSPARQETSCKAGREIQQETIRVDNNREKRNQAEREQGEEALVGNNMPASIDNGAVHGDSSVVGSAIYRGPMISHMQVATSQEAQGSGCNTSVSMMPTIRGRTTTAVPSKFTGNFEVYLT